MSELIFHPEVSLEIKASFNWYEAQVEGLGSDFLSELESAYQAIEELPNTWPKFKTNFRRYLLSKFPYSVIYRPGPQGVFVLAVMHNHRNPGYWENRT